MREGDSRPFSYIYVWANNKEKEWKRRSMLFLNFFVLTSHFALTQLNSRNSPAAAALRSFVL